MNIDAARVRQTGDRTWSTITVTDEDRCCCQHPGKSDLGEHADGAACTGPTLCPRCAHSWSFDHDLDYGPRVPATAAMQAAITAGRTAAGLTHAQLAQLSDVPLGTLTSLAYVRHWLHPLQVRRLAAALGISTSDLAARAADPDGPAPTRPRTTLTYATDTIVVSTRRRATPTGVALPSEQPSRDAGSPNPAN